MPDTGASPRDHIISHVLGLLASRNHLGLAFRTEIRLVWMDHNIGQFDFRYWRGCVHGSHGLARRLGVGERRNRDRNAGGDRRAVEIDVAARRANGALQDLRRTRGVELGLGNGSARCGRV